MKKINLKEVPLVFFSILLIFLVFSYRLTKVPPGINIDESSFGYNASLLAKNLRDENKRFLPVFILTLDGRDWKSPIRMYSTAFIFKIFGRSYYTFKIVSVLAAVLSSFLFFLLLRLFFNLKMSLAGLFLFVTSPSLLLQSHLGFDCIDVLPWMILWLFFFALYCKNRKPISLLISGISLGISFYTYKAMHAIVPVYLGVSLVYLFWFNFIKKSGKQMDVLWFILGIVPFLLPINWLQTHYSGAIYDPSVVSRPSFYDAVYVYLSSFDFSFLFLKGDKMLIHSTGHHGMFLLPCLLLFFFGFIQLYKERKSIFYFIFVSFILTPVFLTLVGSVYRANRLMAYIPLATFIFTLGIKNISEMRNRGIKAGLLFLIFLSITVNYGDFVNYYWNDYPKLISQDFSPNFDRSFYELSNLAKVNKSEAYVEYYDYKAHKTDIEFFWEVYFPNKNLGFWARENKDFPENSFVLTSISGSGELKNYKTIPSLEKGQKTFYVVGKFDSK